VNNGGVHGGDEVRLAAICERVSNWGRWGPDDQAGTANYITDAKRLEAASLVQTGELHSLALPVSKSYPQAPGSSRPNARHEMLAIGDTYADDAIRMAVHGSTHWDSLAHIFHAGRMYNGHLAAEHVTTAGAARNDITQIACRIVARGVLLDVATARGVDELGESYEITVHDLESCLEQQRVEVRSGDVLLIRTGHLGRIQRNGLWEEFSDNDDRNPLEPGLGLDTAVWLHERRIAAVASDNWAVEVINSRAMADLPLHTAAIVHMGLLLGEIFLLDALAVACAADRRYDFLFAATPIPIQGAVGGPVHPVAVR
jgi:kynurenine formamidase